MGQKLSDFKLHFPVFFIDILFYFCYTISYYEMGRCRERTDTSTRKELFQLSEVCGVEHKGYEIYR